MFRKHTEDLNIPLEDRYSNRFIVQLHLFKGIDDTLSCQVVDVSLVEVEKVCINGFSILMMASETVSNYLEKFDVILYFYFSRTQLQRSSRNSTKSPQEYRSRLFNCLIERCCSKSASLVKREVYIEDTDTEHHITLVTREKNQKELESLTESVREMADKP